MTHGRAVGWLTAALLAVGGYAVAMVAAAPVVSDLFELLGFGPRDGGVPPGAATDHVLLLQGVLGSVIVGWVVLLVAVVRGPVRRGERWAVVAVAASLTVWFVLDTGWSLVAGSPAHALFNVAFAALTAPPVVALLRLSPAPPAGPGPAHPRT